MSAEAKLILLIGKIAAGKSTLAQELGHASQTLVISEDKWLASLYPEEIVQIADYVKYSRRLKTRITTSPLTHHTVPSDGRRCVLADVPANWSRFLLMYLRTGRSTCCCTCELVEVLADVPAN